MRATLLLVSGLLSLLAAPQAFGGGPLGTHPHELARKRISSFLSSSTHAAALSAAERDKRLEHLSLDLHIKPFDTKDRVSGLPLSRMRLDAALLLEWKAHHERSPEPSVVLSEMYGTKLLLSRRVAQPVMMLKLQHPGGEVKDVLPNQFELFGIRQAEDIHRLIGDAMDRVAPEDLD